MAIDPDMAQIMRADLARLDGLSERKMFGGLAFMRAGHMLAGVMSTAALIYRVGKPREERAIAHEGVTVMTHGGRRMGGFAMIADAFRCDHGLRHALLALALENAAELPPKEQ